MADENKTEKATPRRRKKARDEGQIARSRDLPGVLAIAGVTAVLALMAHGALEHWTAFFRNTLEAAATGDIESNGPVLFWSALEVFRWIAPILCTALVVAMGAGFAQGGINIAPGALGIKVQRFNPASRLGQIFSLTGLSGILKSLLPFTAILWVGVSAIETHWGDMVRSSYLGMSGFAALLGNVALGVAWKSGAILLAWSAVDYLLVWRKIESDLRMSKQEIREEMKESDGNPATRARVRRIQRQMRRKQLLKAAETATVVITNPTHYAVALRYEVDMPAPIVVAKGRDLLAERIKQIARDRGIIMMENRPLAQALYKSVEVGDAIPSRLYHAVAEILVVVFRAQAEVRRQQARRQSKNASGEVVAQ